MTTCANLRQNWYIHFQNTVFKTLVTDERTNEQTGWEQKHKTVTAYFYQLTLMFNTAAVLPYRTPRIFLLEYLSTVLANIVK